MTSAFSGAAERGAAVAYGEVYVPDAMENLADLFDYAVNDYGAEGDEVADLFCMSQLARSFARGEPWAVAGKSGCELFALLAEELGYAEPPTILPAYRFEKTPEYWVGWTAAYVQWRLAMSFDRLFFLVPYDEFRRLYHPWHEASEERFAALVAERAVSAQQETALARLRKQLGLSQRELAARSGVSLRSIQMYEQRRKDINRAQVRSVVQLARALHCSVEDVLEPEAITWAPA